MLTNSDGLQFGIGVSPPPEGTDEPYMVVLILLDAEGTVPITEDNQEHVIAAAHYHVNGADGILEDFTKAIDTAEGLNRKNSLGTAGRDYFA